MVGDKFKQAHDFRSRAERLREIAGGVAGADQRELLMQLAEEYDEMARSAAAVAKLEVAQAIGNGVDGFSPPEPLGPVPSPTKEDWK